jgi:signal peptide peptidase SppA
LEFEPASDEGEEEASLRVQAGDVGAPRLFQSLTDQVWAVQSPAVLREMATIAQRHGSMEAVERRRGARADDTRRVTIRDGVAIVPVMGPIFPRANMFTEVSGATSIQTLALDLQKMLDRPDIKAVLLNVDSPGGAVTGVDEMAGIIKEVAAKKPVTAYVGGAAASAAYWLASAAREIVVTRTGQVGSIGVVATVPQQQEPDDQGVMDFEIVSSNAPNKRPDPTTDDGRQAVLDRINPVEGLFIDAVAGNRGLSRDTILSDFGQGNIVVGQQAVDRGMADRVGTFEGVLAELQKTPTNPNAIAAAAAKGAEQATNSAAASAAPLTTEEEDGMSTKEGKKPAGAEAAAGDEKQAADPAAIA